MQVWSPDGSAPIVLKGHKGWVFCLKQLKDGRLASGSRDKTVRIFEGKAAEKKLLTKIVHTFGNFRVECHWPFLFGSLFSR